MPNTHDKQDQREMPSSPRQSAIPSSVEAATVVPVNMPGRLPVRRRDNCRCGEGYSHHCGLCYQFECDDCFDALDHGHRVCCSCH